MKFLFTWLPLWLVACVACGVNSLEREFLCPICGTHWEQRVETSGTSRGLRLDLRQLGDVVDPPTLPQCPKCRFPLFSEQLIEQAKDPAKEKAFKRLRTFVLGPDFQMLAAKNPSYFALAQVQAIIGDERNPTPHRYIALSYLRASWQVEEREVACRRLLEKAREHYVAALEGLDTEDRRRTDLALLCGEIERRLEKWDEAESRFRELESSGVLKGTPQAAIPGIQIRLIEQRDSAPHTLDGGEVAANRPPPQREMRFENPGQVSVASNRLEMPVVANAEPAPKAPDAELPVVLFELPDPILKLPSAPSEKSEGGLTLGVLPAASPPVTTASRPRRGHMPPGYLDARVKPAAPPKAPEEPAMPLPKHEPVPLVIPVVDTAPALPATARETPPPAGLVKPSPAPARPPSAPKPDPNFSDNPD